MAASVFMEPHVTSSSYFLRGHSLPQQDDYDLTSLATLYPRAAQVLEAKMRRAESASSLASPPLISSPSLESLRMSGFRQSQRHARIKDTRVSSAGDYTDEQQHSLYVDEQGDLPRCVETVLGRHATILPQQSSDRDTWKPRAGERARCALADRGRQVVPQFIDFSSHTATSSTAPPSQSNSTSELVIQNRNGGALASNTSSTKSMAYSDENSRHAVNVVTSPSSNHSAAAPVRRAVSEPQLQIADRRNVDVERCLGSGMMGQSQNRGCAPSSGRVSWDAQFEQLSALSGDGLDMLEHEGREANRDVSFGGVHMLMTQGADGNCKGTRISNVVCSGKDAICGNSRQQIGEEDGESPQKRDGVNMSNSTGDAVDATSGELPDGFILRERCGGRESAVAWDLNRGALQIGAPDGVLVGMRPTVEKASHETAYPGFQDYSGVGFTNSGLLVRGAASNTDRDGQTVDARGRREPVYGDIHPAFKDPQHEVNDSGREASGGEQHDSMRMPIREEVGSNGPLYGSLPAPAREADGSCRSRHLVSEHAGEISLADDCTAAGDGRLVGSHATRSSPFVGKQGQQVGSEKCEAVDSTNHDSSVQLRETDDHIEFHRHDSGQPFRQPDQVNSKVRVQIEKVDRSCRDASGGERYDSMCMPMREEARINGPLYGVLPASAREADGSCRSRHLVNEHAGEMSLADDCAIAGDGSVVGSHAPRCPLVAGKQGQQVGSEKCEAVDSTHHDSSVQLREADDNTEFHRHDSGEPFGRPDQVQSNLHAKIEQVDHSCRDASAGERYDSMCMPMREEAMINGPLNGVLPAPTREADSSCGSRHLVTEHAGEISLADDFTAAGDGSLLGSHATCSPLVAGKQQVGSEKCEAVDSTNHDSSVQLREADDNTEFHIHDSGEPFGRLDQVQRNLQIEEAGSQVGRETTTNAGREPYDINDMGHVSHSDARRADGNAALNVPVDTATEARLDQAHSNVHMQIEEKGNEDYDSKNMAHAAHSGLRQADGNVVFNGYVDRGTLARPDQMYGKLHMPLGGKGGPVGEEGSGSAPYSSVYIESRQHSAANREHVLHHTSDSTQHCPVTPAFGNFNLESPSGDDGNCTRINISSAVRAGNDAMCGSLPEHIGGGDTNSLRKNLGVNINDAIHEGIDATSGGLPKQVSGGDGSFLRGSCDASEIAEAWDPIRGASRMGDRDGFFVSRRPIVDEASRSSPGFDLPIHETAHAGFHAYSVRFVDSGLPVQGAASKTYRNGQTVDQARGEWEVHPAFNDPGYEVDHSGRKASEGEQCNNMCMPIKEEGRGNGPTYGALPAPTREGDDSCRRRNDGSHHAGAMPLSHYSTTDGDGRFVGSHAIRSPLAVGMQGQHVDSEKFEAVDPTHHDRFMQHREADGNSEFHRHLGSDNIGLEARSYYGTTDGSEFSVGSDAIRSPLVVGKQMQHVGNMKFGAVDPTHHDSFTQVREADDNARTRTYTFGRPDRVHSSLHMQIETKVSPLGRENAGSRSCDGNVFGNVPHSDFNMSSGKSDGSSHAVPQVKTEVCDPLDAEKCSTSNERDDSTSTDRKASIRGQDGRNLGNGYFQGDVKATQELHHAPLQMLRTDQLGNGLGTGHGSKTGGDSLVGQMSERIGAGLGLHVTRDTADARGYGQPSDVLFVPIGDRGGAPLRTPHLGKDDTTGSLPFDPSSGADGPTSGRFGTRYILRSGSVPFLGADEGFQDLELLRSEFAGTDAAHSFAEGERAFDFAPGFGPSPGHAVRSVEGTSRPDSPMLPSAKVDGRESDEPADGLFVPVGDRGGASLGVHYRCRDSTTGLSSLLSDSGLVADGPRSRSILRSGSAPCLGVDEGFQDSELAFWQSQTLGFDATDSECDRVFEFAPSIGPRFGFGLMPAGAEGMVLVSAEAARRIAEEQGNSREAKSNAESKSPAVPESKVDTEAASEPKANSEAVAGKGKSKGKAPPLPAAAKGKGKAPPPPSAKGKDGGKGKGSAPPPKASQGDAQAKTRQASIVRAMPKTKPLSWRKIDAANEGTLWALNRSCMEDFQLERDQIEAIFSWAQPPKPDQQTGNAPKDKTKEKEQIKLTTKERVMGICIGLRCVKNLGSDGIRQAILDLDSNKLTAEATERLLMCDAKLRQPTVLPTTEELAAARVHVSSGLPDDTLDEASRFIVAVHDIPHLRERLHLHQFRLSFDDNVASLREELALLRTALQQVRESQGFAVILMFVLKAGNILNDGTDRGNASGFRIDSLAALTLLKGNKGQAGAATKGTGTAPAGGAALSLVDYLVGVIEQQRPKLLEEVPRELKDVAEASRLELEEIERNAREKRLELQKIAKSIGVVLRNEGAATTMAGDEEATKERQSITVLADPGLAGASEFLEQTMCTLDSIEEEIAEVKKAYKEVSEFFGEERKAKADQIPVHEWLGFVTRFLGEMQKALAAHRLRVERAKRAETAQAQKAIRGARKKTMIFAARQHRDRKNSGSFCGRRESMQPRLTVAKLGKDGEKLLARQRRTLRGDRLQAAANACASPGSLAATLSMVAEAAEKRYAGRSPELIARRRRRIKRRVSLKIKKLMQEKCRRERARHLVLKYRKVKFTQVYDSDCETDESSDREGDRSEAGVESNHDSVTSPVAPKTASRNSAPGGRELEKVTQQQSRSSSRSRGLWGRVRLSLTEATVEEEKASDARRVAKNTWRQGQGLRRSPSSGNVRSRRSSEERIRANTEIEQKPVEAYASLNAQAAYEEGLQKVPRLRQFRIQSASDVGRGRLSTEPETSFKGARRAAVVKEALPRVESVDNEQKDEESTAAEKNRVKPHPQRTEGEEIKPRRRLTDVGEIKKSKSSRRLTWAHDADVDKTDDKDQQEDRKDEAESKLVPAHREITRMLASLGMEVSHRRPQQRNTMPGRVFPQAQTDSTDSEPEGLTFGKCKSEPTAYAQSPVDAPSIEAPAAKELDGEKVQEEKEQLVSCAEDSADSSDASPGVHDFKPENPLRLHPLSRQEDSEPETSPRPRAATWQESRRSMPAAKLPEALSRLVESGPVPTRRFTIDSGLPATALSRRRRSDLGTMLEAVANLGEELRRGFAVPRASLTE